MESCKSETCKCSGSCGDICSPCTSVVHKTDSIITRANHIDHFLARWGYNRTGHQVEPGLYQLGSPTTQSPVFASANYTLSFDALRFALNGHDAYILVLNTYGINVWCAAGKGTFGTDELVNRIEAENLKNIVTHRRIIIPQLGAPGIAAHEVKQRTGFSVEYGPVRAKDLSDYLLTGKASPDMRRVEFSLSDRIVLIPMELVHIALPALFITIALWFVGPLSALAALAGVLTGVVLFPVLLPIIPSQDYSMKGFLLGGMVAIPFAIAFAGSFTRAEWAAGIGAVIPLLLIPAVTAYLALNFTGSTPYTSRTGVKKEIFRYVPIMAGMAALGVLLGIILGISRIMGMI